MGWRLWGIVWGFSAGYARGMLIILLVLFVHLYMHPLYQTVSLKGIIQDSLERLESLQSHVKIWSPPLL